MTSFIITDDMCKVDNFLSRIFFFKEMIEVKNNLIYIHVYILLKSFNKHVILSLQNFDFICTCTYVPL